MLSKKVVKNAVLERKNAPRPTPGRGVAKEHREEGEPETGQSQGTRA